MELYYYTTTDTLRFILEKGDIYATNIRYMNDSEEYINGVTELWRVINNKDLMEKWLSGRDDMKLTYEALKRPFTEAALVKNMSDAEFYSISFCRKNDLLSQWAIYARESGVSIKMNFEREYYSFIAESDEMIQEMKEKEEEKKKFAKWRAVPQEVFYFTHNAMENQEEYEERACRILDRLYQKSGVDPKESMDEDWRYTSTYIKRYDFYQEEESRLVFNLRNAAYIPKVYYRCDRNVLKPYLDIECENGWPIWEIMIGPGFNQDVVYKSVIHFLDYSAIKNGIVNGKDYRHRVENFFRPYASEFETIAQKLSHQYDDEKIDQMDLPEAQNKLESMVRDICKYIQNEMIGEEICEYVNTRYFTRCGIIVSKSCIPYIF